MYSQNSQVFYLVYQSQLKTPRNRVNRAVQAIAKQAMRLNKKQRLTGVLGYCIESTTKTVSLVQYLEGSYEAVHAVFEKIRHDNRHDAIQILFEGSQSQPLFPNWQMKLVNLQNYPNFITPSHFKKTPRLSIASSKFFRVAIQDMPYEIQSTFTGHTKQPRIAMSRNSYKSNLNKKSTLQDTTNITAGTTGCFVEWNKQNFQEFLHQLKQDYVNEQSPTHQFDYYEEEGELPTWVHNRKLLGRVFLIWLLLAGYMLFSVLSSTRF